MTLRHGASVGAKRADPQGSVETMGYAEGLSETSPSWAGGPGVCADTEEYGAAYVDNLHLLGHAVVGWLPLSLGYVVAMRHWRPALLPRWAGRPESRAVASLTPGLSRPRSLGRACQRTLLCRAGWLHLRE
jgi:hypothetical protein